MDRSEADIPAFLRSFGWQNAIRIPLAGDMSSRRYERLRSGDKTLVLMVSDKDVSSFMDITNWLLGLGCSAPRVKAIDAKARLIALEDFGDVPVRMLLSEPTKRKDAFELVVDLLLRIREGTNSNLSRPSADQLIEWTLLADQHYSGLDTEGLRGFRQVLRSQLAEALQETTAVSLRDFHSDNLMWLPDRTGINRLGLLDYQDAFLTHPAYDLMSFLTDARTPISAQERDLTIENYLALSKDAPDSFKAAFFALSAQRNLRILGIFARAGKRLDKLPLVHRYFRDALEHPMFDKVRRDTLVAVPAPEHQPS